VIARFVIVALSLMCIVIDAQAARATAEDVSAGPEQPLSGGLGASGFDLVPLPVFWSVLALTVIVLLALVVRLMKREAL